MSVVRIAQISDPHFGTIREGVREGLAETLRTLSPNLVLITGDITQRARRRQFQQAYEFCQSLQPIPVFALPGNHDIPLFNVFARFFSPYGGFRKHFQNKLEMDWSHGGVQLTCLNSTSRWRHVQGDFDLERIEGRLRVKEPATQFRIAALHHPMDCPKETDEKNLLKGRVKTMEIFERAGIDLVLGGHIHDPYVTLSEDRYPEVKRRMILAVAGTCLSWRIRKDAPNSFNLIEIGTQLESSVSITRYDIGADKLFRPQPGPRRFVRRGETGWLTS